MDGLFSLSMQVPDEAGSQGLLVRILDAPDGAVLRGVDDVVAFHGGHGATSRQRPDLTRSWGTVARIRLGALAVDVRMDEDIGLGDVQLGWRVMVSSFGLAGEVLGEGLEPMTLRGARQNGADAALACCAGFGQRPSRRHPDAAT